MREFEDEPVLRDALHPRPGVGDDLPGRVEPVVPDAQRPEHPAAARPVFAQFGFDRLGFDRLGFDRLGFDRLVFGRLVFGRLGAWLSGGVLLDRSVRALKRSVRSARRARNLPSPHGLCVPHGLAKLRADPDGLAHLFAHLRGLGGPWWTSGPRALSERRGLGEMGGTGRVAAPGAGRRRGLGGCGGHRAGRAGAAAVVRAARRRALRFIRAFVSRSHYRS
ncbi:hypothetical protein [Actinomadura meyerae]|uniref:hypothetical protein n=1 Tax=Actinomadura meyerae TaxID=240840 RepID=UPI0015C66047|nr:hypothetical protein [Actinomadura meyerae]